jgi:hypothetical protein
MMCRDLHPTRHKVMLNPYELEDAQRSLGPYIPPAVEEGVIAQAAPAGEKVGGAEFGLGECAASHLCCSPEHKNIECILCINCNKTAHKLCAELLFFQSPVPDKHVISIKDLGVGGKGRLHKLHKKDWAEVFFCILCLARIVQTKLGKTKKKALESSPPIPIRARKATKYKGPSASLIADMVHANVGQKLLKRNIFKNFYRVSKLRSSC